MASPAPTPPVALLLSKLKAVKPQSGGWVALCPAHDDSSRSLKVDVGKDGRALARCFVGCSFADIVSSAGLTMADTFMDSPDRRAVNAAYPVRPTPPLALHPTKPEPSDDDERRTWPVVARYDYVDASGTMIYQVERKEPPVQPAGDKRKKFFGQRRKGPTGWIYNLDGIDERPLYRLPELLDDLAHERTILLVEGEKDCITVRDRLGLPAVAHSGGSNGWRPEYAKQLAGASVVILPDNDEPGRKWAATAAESLIDAGCSVRMLALPLTTIGADVTDWVDAGGTAPQLERLLTKAVPWHVGDPVPLPLAPPKFKLLTVSELEALPPLEWLVGEEMAGVFPASGLVALFGAPGGGKSFLAADLCCTIAAKRHAVAPVWFGNTVQRGSVIYVLAEGGRGFRSRVKAWRTRHDATADDLSLSFVLEPVNLYGSDDVSHILRAADLLAEPPALIVFDTLARSMVGGDDNSSQDVGMVIDRADRIRRETGASVMFAHHARKDDDVERGSGALRGGVDTLCLVRVDEDGGHVLSCEKQKDAETFDPIRFYLHPVGDSCVVGSQPPSGPKALTANQRAALKALAELFPKGASASEWLRASGVPDRTFYRVRAWMIHEGYVAELERGNYTRYSTTPSGHWALNGQVL